MQRIWDLYSQKSRINLIVCGSIYSMMTKIFKDKKEQTIRFIRDFWL